MKSIKLVRSKSAALNANLRLLRKPFWIAKVNWTWQHKSNDPVSAVKVTVSELKKHYKAYCHNKLSCSNKLYSRFTDIHYHPEVRKNVIKIINSGADGVVSADGNWNGIAISFKSAHEARRLSKESSEQAVLEEEKENNKRLKRGYKHADTIASLKDRTIHYLFKQDYDYRGLEDTFKGTVKLSHLVEIEQAISKEDYDKSDSLVKKHFGAGPIEYSVDEIFMSNNGKIVKKLAADKVVSGSGEIGYEALAKTSTLAKKKVRSLFLKWADLD